MTDINNLKFDYGKKVVFENISFNMELEKIYGLLGAFINNNPKSVHFRTVSVRNRTLF